MISIKAKQTQEYILDLKHEKCMWGNTHTVHTTHLQGPRTGHRCVETDIQYIPHTYKAREQVAGVWKHTYSTHHTPTRPENRSPVCGNTHTVHTTHLQGPRAGCRYVVTHIKYTLHTYKARKQVAGVGKHTYSTHHTPTRPENRLPV